MKVILMTFDGLENQIIYMYVQIQRAKKYCKA